MTIQEFTSLLFEVEINTHVAHWQAESLSTHLALGDIYEGVVDYRDRIVETAQTKGILRGYKTKLSLNENMDIIPYLEGVIEDCYTFREDKLPFVQQITDELIEFLSKGVYKLRNLK